jgi:MFS family permease
LIVLSQAGADAPYFPDVMVSFLLVGLGAGLAFLPLLTIAMANVPAADAGLASGIVNVSIQMSAAIGVAVLGTVATDHTNALAAHGHGHIAALLGGYHLAFVIAAGCAVAGILLALAVLRKPSPPRFAPKRRAKPEVEVEVA